MATAARAAGARLDGQVSSYPQDYATPADNLDEYWVRVHGYAYALKESARAGLQRASAGHGARLQELRRQRDPWNVSDWATSKAGKSINNEHLEVRLHPELPEGQDLPHLLHVRAVALPLRRAGGRRHRSATAGLTLREYLWRQQAKFGRPLRPRGPRRRKRQTPTPTPTAPPPPPPPPPKKPDPARYPGLSSLFFASPRAPPAAARQLVPLDQERVVALGRVDLAVARPHAGRARHVDERADLARPVQDVVLDAHAGQPRPAARGARARPPTPPRPSPMSCRSIAPARIAVRRHRSARRASRPGARDS